MTPLTIARGHLEILEPDVSAPDAATVAETRDVVLSASSGRMERIVDRLLLVERALSPEFLRLTPTDAAAQFVTDDLSPLARDRRSAVGARRRRTGHGRRRCRSAHAQALDLMLENAVAHTGVGDTIAVGSRAVGGPW